MRKLAAVLIVLAAVSTLPWGCGGTDLAGDLISLLDGRIGEIRTLSYTCVTQDVERTYREEFELSFPAEYTYRLHRSMGGVMLLSDYAAQSGSEIFRADAVPGPSGEAASVEIEELTSVPPLRCTGTYLSLYHLMGNGDYFSSLIALVEGGDLRVGGSDTLDGVEVYRLSSAPGLKPEVQLWLDRTTGLQVRKELKLAEGRVITFLYEDVVENPELDEVTLPPDTVSLFGEAGRVVDATARDGACQPLDLENADAVLGFTPLVPQVPGFELSEAWWRDPSASTLTDAQGSLSFPEGFREAYLVLRGGPRQVEIRQTPFDPDFSYYTTGMGALSGAYLIRQETWGEDTGNAAYSAAMDCQELRLTAGDIEFMITGDLSREELRELAVQLQESAPSSP